MSVSILMVGSEALPFSKTGGLADVLGALAAGARPARASRHARDAEVSRRAGPGHDAHAFRCRLAGAGRDTADRAAAGRRRARGAGRSARALRPRVDLRRRAATIRTTRGASGFSAGPRWNTRVRSAATVRRPARARLAGRSCARLSAHALCGRSAARRDGVGVHDSQPRISGIVSRRIGSRRSISAAERDVDGRPRILGPGQLSEGRDQLFADVITTVSPTYAKEIQTEEYGAGFEGILAGASRRSVWRAQRHRHRPVGSVDAIPFCRSRTTTTASRKRTRRGASCSKCWARVSRSSSLARPLVGHRVAAGRSEGLRSPRGGCRTAADADVQLCRARHGRSAVRNDVARSGGAPIPDRFGGENRVRRAARAPDRGAADIFLMPSRFEPCGLNQMYSMRYGTVPVVRATGGLDDTVTDYNEKTGTGTGFNSRTTRPRRCWRALDRARPAFANPSIWKKLQLAGMRQDFSWDRSAREYVKLYERATHARVPGGNGMPRRDAIKERRMASEKIQIFTDGNFDHDRRQVRQARAGRFLGGVVRPLPAACAHRGRAGHRLRRQGHRRQAQRRRKPQHRRPVQHPRHSDAS